MTLHPKSKIVALRALLAVTWAEERRLLTIINSEQASTEEISKALKDLHKLWSQIVLQLADIEDATVTSTQIALHPIDRRVGNARDDELVVCALEVTAELSVKARCGRAWTRFTICESCSRIMRFHPI
jgi:hypothetical protein